jgi:signal transduction histidine kinase
MNAPYAESPTASAADDARGWDVRRALITGVLIAILVVSASVSAGLGFLLFAVGLDAGSTNITGYLGFVVLYALLLLGATEAAAAAALTLAHRRREPRSLPGWSAYVSVAQSVAIAIAGVGALLCVGVVVGFFVGRTAPAQILVFGLALAGALVWFLRRRRGRATTLRTRSFVVIVVAMVVPCLVLSVLGVSAYLQSWDRASMLYWDQAAYGARVLRSDVGSLRRVPGLGAAAEARLSREIVRAFANDNRSGALRSTMSAVRTEQVLPRWAIRILERRGYAIGMMNGLAAPGGRLPDVVAWRVGRQDVRYFRSDYYNNPGTVDAPLPYELLGRFASAVVAGVILVLALGLLGAWILSRSVVRPVRRLAEASGRLAEGEAGVTVTPQGPRELRELAVSFNDMNSKLTKAQETEQAFLLSVSHELKTPLTSVRGYAEGIGDGTLEPVEGAAVIGAEASRLERLVGDLLESGRMRKSAFTVRREPVDLVAVAEDVARRYDATARDAGLTLLLGTEGGGAATADHDRVLQVVSNLAENAIRCTPAPGTVTITTAPGAITVADTGRGLTSDDLPRAFERFYLYSRYGTDRPVGTGLGLAIVKELAEAMGGEVSVSSAVGVGTAFTVALPPGEAPRAEDAPVDGGASTTVEEPRATSTTAATAGDGPAASGDGDA